MICYVFLRDLHNIPKQKTRPVFALGGAEAADGSVPAAEKSPAKAAKAKKHKGLDDGIVQGHGLCLHVFADVGRTSTLPRSIYKVTSGHSSGFLNGDMPGETIL